MVGLQTGIDKALADKPVASPDQKFIYSDINFILLGEIVRRVGGKPLDEFARDEVFLPLGHDRHGLPAPGILAAAHRADGN